MTPIMMVSTAHAIAAMAAVPDTSHVFQLTKGAHRTDAAVERAGHQFARRHLFPELGNPVIHERRVQLPQMQMRVVPIFTSGRNAAALGGSRPGALSSPCVSIAPGNASGIDKRLTYTRASALASPAKTGGSLSEDLSEKNFSGSDAIARSVPLE